MARSGFRGTSSLLMVLAVAAMGGFLYWLYIQAQSVERTVTPVTQDTAASTEEGVTLASLSSSPRAAIGKNAVLDSVEVGASLGRGVFTLAVADTMGYPVLLSRDMIQRGLTVYGGDRVTVGGRIYTLNDSIRQAWVGLGAVDSASADSIPKLASFLLADSVRILQ